VLFSSLVKLDTVANIMAYESNDDPPELTNGKGIPVGTNKSIEVEILTNA